MFQLVTPKVSLKIKLVGPNRELGSVQGPLTFEGQLFVEWQLQI